MAADDDATTHRLRVVQTSPPEPKQRSSNAEAAARYRARQRGQSVPKRKPGPKPPPVMELRQQIRELENRIQTQQLQLRIMGERLARRQGTLTVEGVAGELLTVLRRTPRPGWTHQSIGCCFVISPSNSKTVTNNGRNNDG